MAEKYPICPDCGEQHPPEPRREIPPLDKKVRAKLNRRVNRLMDMLKTQDPEFVLRLLVTMLSSVASTGNARTQQNVVRVLAGTLGVRVMFGIPAPSPEELANWKPGKIDPKDVH